MLVFFQLSFLRRVMKKEDYYVSQIVLCEVNKFLPDAH